MLEAKRSKRVRPSRNHQQASAQFSLEEAASMIAVSLRNRWLWSCLSSAATLFFLILPSSGQQTDQLQEQLEQLKQQYETTTHDLEQRIAALEQQIQKEKEAREQQLEKEKEENAKTKQSTTSAIELAAQQVQKSVLGESEQVGAKFQGDLSSEPTYDFLREADEKIQKLQEQLGTF